MDPQERRVAAVIQNKDGLLPLSRFIHEDDVVLLLTPAIPPNDEPRRCGPSILTSDPFEPLGRALARSCPQVRHVPYVPRNGITATLVVHIRHATHIIFVVTGPPRHGQPSQLGLADIVRNLSEDKSFVVLFCCSYRDLDSTGISFPTIIHVPEQSRDMLESAAEAILHEGGGAREAAQPLSQQLSPLVPRSSPEPVRARKLWPVEDWDGFRDFAAVKALWDQCLPDQFRLNDFRLQQVLRRSGYARHYVVREPGSREVAGFCATYTTYADSGGERLIGSIAALLVAPSSRLQGIGLTLHGHAVRNLTATRGVERIQLGSTFPRLLYGLPFDSPHEGWFRRRNWPMDGHRQGAGQETCDWIAHLDNWPVRQYGPSRLMFRRCGFEEFESVLRVIERELMGKDHMGWFDQYSKLAGSFNINDIVLGLDGHDIVAIALTYVRNTGSPAAEDLPWAATIADDMGGVTCVVVTEMASNERDGIMIRLLDFCKQTLVEQGARKMFIDAVQGGEDGFQSIGFHKWARYRDIWRLASEADTDAKQRANSWAQTQTQAQAGPAPDRLGYLLPPMSSPDWNVIGSPNASGVGGPWGRL